MHMPSGMQLLVIVLIVLILFGGKKIPELAKGLGSGIKNFKKAVKEDDEEVATASKIDENEKKTDTKSTSSTEPKQA
ncbi:twin-arginine translocase TatA/TatE family subunit [Aliarcobacter cryaerophilus]|mgnify:FL=1|uniref:twin-arginine translocase TatA/TatE family subunit n=1 Tax=Aliarcobacter cryaerophilus TaxID=28198 RepID=UPI0021B464DA|nr:twin-arginine translocase TatA/TatE family subunit [Aliarcobacter cryaerophilus]MCT7444214.1 twin-arginine translocase TatA/TatE family subunit [Aliarcobacter cryaerophilus]MCT7479346.1 twin-arginine translocase TatA/TatE family subunit [Aliarcobacter cryaerophilus]